METNANGWVLVNKGYSPGHFISPDGKMMLITNEKWDKQNLTERTAELVNLENLPKQNIKSVTAKYANELAKSKIPFLDEVLIGIKSQAERGLFKSQVACSRITDKTILELKSMGFDIYKGGVDNSDYIIDWELKAGSVDR